ncbi:MAG TPA: hypothetical protein VFS05_00195 [Gemmatimonadaceae bacterium]|nr:hypothetical protein [Gemmatimonadaceae bacterium]
MSAAARRLTRTRAALVAAAGASAALWGLAAGTIVCVLLSALGGMLPAAAGARVPAALAAGLAATVISAARARHAASRARVALWIEERVPELRYSLVTLLEAERSTETPALEREIAALSWRAPVRRAVTRAVGVPALAAGAAALLLLALPTGGAARGAAGRRAGAGVTASAPASPMDRLRGLEVTVTPPAYSGLRAATLADPSSVTALAGSRLAVEGEGSADGLSAQVGAARAAVGAGGRGWRLTTAMPARPAALRLLAPGGAERIIILEPRPDSVPVVTLTTPARDTILRAPTGRIALAADARDDFGLGAAWLEFIISSGEGESFTFRSGVVARQAAAGAREASLRAGLPLDSLALRPGDLVHLRAVARDRNDVTGPGTGYSETRTIRIAREGEYDSISVEAAPPPENDRAEISQRMLIVTAEALERRRPRLARPTVVSESRRIAADQARLRRRVGDIIFSRLGGETPAEHSHEGESAEEHAAHDRPLSPEEVLQAAERATNHGVGEVLDFEGDETPVVAINRPLLEAYNAMWDAGRELEVGEPARALPHMRAALAAIQRARAAERIYLRGRPPAVIVDLARVRMTGKVDSTPAVARTPRPALAGTAARRAARLEGALDLLTARDTSRAAAASVAAGIDSLALLRLDAITGGEGSQPAPALARALGEAIDALRAGRDATEPLARARRLLASEPEARPALTRWSGAW